MLNHVQKTDPFIFEHLQAELERQKSNIEMIASESFVPPEVMEIQGSVITNTTLVGYPGSRSQVGSHLSDELELEAIRRAQDVFGCGYANMQVYSGSTANYGVYASVLNPGDRVLSMSPAQGGHTTHGYPGNISEKVYQFSYYGVDRETEMIDMDEVRKIAEKIHPQLILAGATFYPRLIDYKAFADIAASVGAYLMVDMAHVCGLVAAGVIPSPVPYADFVSTSTTKTFMGPRSGMILCKSEHAEKLDKGVFPGLVASVHMNEVAAKCWSLGYAKTKEFKEVMKQILLNSKALAEELKQRGFRIVAGTSDNHLILADVRSFGITGKEMQTALHKAGISVNNILVPYDTNPKETSGIRIGLTCVTQRGMREKDMGRLADIYLAAAKFAKDPDQLSQVKDKSSKFIAEFPLYPGEVF